MTASRTNGSAALAIDGNTGDIVYQVLNLPILDVAYEQMVVNHEAMSRKLVAFLGLEWNAACLRFHENTRAVLTASNQQVRRG